MDQRYKRLPRGYDKAGVTTAHRVGELLSAALDTIQQRYQERPDIIMAAWSDLVGPQFSSMTRAISFIDGVLTVKVGNATLYSLLCHHEKGRLLRLLRKRFPKVPINNILFRRG